MWHWNLTKATSLVGTSLVVVAALYKSCEFAFLFVSVNCPNSQKIDGEFKAALLTGSRGYTLFWFIGHNYCNLPVRGRQSAPTGRKLSYKQAPLGSIPVLLIAQIYGCFSRLEDWGSGWVDFSRGLFDQRVGECWYFINRKHFYNLEYAKNKLFFSEI